MRNFIVQTVISSERGEEDFPPESLDAFVEWLNRMAAEVPQEWRSTARVEIDEAGYYDDATARITITYMRPETQGERALRENQESHARDLAERLERDTLKRLIDKYGVPE